MNIIGIFYVLYFLISISVVHLMARILSRTSATFLLEAFQGDSDVVLRVDRLVIASFFLANIGFVVSNAPYTYFEKASARQLLTTLLDKLGSAMLFIGFTLFLGLWIFTRMRRLREHSSVSR